MFSHLASKLPNLATDFEAMFDRYRETLENAKEVPEKPEDLEEGQPKPEPYYKLNQSGYRLVSFPHADKQIAIQTVYDRNANEHRLVFYQVVGDENEKKLARQREFVIRSNGQEVSCWLTNHLVTYQIVGQCALFFRLNFDEDENVWQYELMKYDMLKDKEESHSKHEFNCLEEPEDYELEEGEKYEVLAVMIADEFAGNKRAPINKDDLEEVVEQVQFIIL